jgi:hypothetical protein
MSTDQQNKHEVIAEDPEKIVTEEGALRTRCDEHTQFHDCKIGSFKALI